MDISTAQEISRKLKISRDSVVREEYEILLLKEIFESEYGSSLVFKGGTALRLAYNSPRFSEDLDFTLIKKINKKNFLLFLNDLVKKYPTITAVETMDKFYTVFALVKIKEDYLERSFSIKIEVSKRESSWIPDKDFSQQLIRSEITPLSVLAQVALLKRIMKEKKDAIKNRKAARDIFDFWFINQLLKKAVKPNFAGYNKEQVKSELHRFLPGNYWRLIDSWLR